MVIQTDDAFGRSSPRPVSSISFAANRSGIELRPRRVEHELFVDAGSSGGVTAVSDNGLGECAISAARTNAT